MENTVKAVFIASAIIIALAVITLVVTIFLKNRVLINDGSTKVDFATISYHNSQFTTYEKDDLTYSQLMSFIGVIVENNNRQTDENYMMSILLERYDAKSGGIYKPSGVLDSLICPDTNEFINNPNYIYLNNNSVYKGKVFKVSLMYNDLGIIDKAKIEKIN